MQNFIIENIEKAIEETYLLSKNDGDLLLKSFVSELLRYKLLVQDHWPLSEQEKKTIDIGRVGVREFDQLYPDYVTLLCNVGALLREEMNRS